MIPSDTIPPASSSRTLQSHFAKRKFLIGLMAALAAFAVLAEAGERLKEYRVRREQVLDKTSGDRGRIVFLAMGDSMTYGVGAEKGEDYPMQLAAPFKRLYPGVPLNVYNIGVSGTSTSGGLSLLQKFFEGRERRVDFAFVLYGLNNLWNLYDATFWERARNGDERFAAAVAEKARANGLFRIEADAYMRKNLNPRTLLGISPNHYFVMLKEHGWNLFFANHGETLPAMWYESDIEEIIQFLRDHGVQPIMMPYHYAKFPELNAMIRDAAKQLNIPLIEIEKPFEDYLWHRLLSGDLFHPNAKGYRDLAERIMTQFSELYPQDEIRKKLGEMRKRNDWHSR